MHEWRRDEVTIANTPAGTLQVSITGGGSAFLTVSKSATYNVQTQDL